MISASDTATGLIANPSTDDATRQAAYRVLQSLHTPASIEFLSDRLNSSKQESLLAFAALCRLYHVEGDWKGNSWGTRPDTRGPYYQPETWQQSERIAKILDAHLAKADQQTSTQLLMLMSRNRIDISNRLDHWLAKATDMPLEPDAILDLFSRADTLTASAVKKLIALLDSDLSVDQHLRANGMLLHSNTPDATDGIAKSIQQAILQSTPDHSNALLKQLRGARELNRHTHRLGALVNQSTDNRLAAAVIVNILDDQPSKENKTPLTNAVDAAWADESLAKDVLRTIQNADFRDGEAVVRRALLDTRPEVVRVAQQIAADWELASLSEYAGPKIGDLDVQAVLKQVTGMQGDATKGRQVFSALGCAKCHDVSPTKDLRGPYLPNVAKTYKRDQLTEAVLMPSKSIAQGFVQNVFLMDDGRVLSGFVTSEAETEIFIRDKDGVLIKIPVESIEQRTENKVSVMPEGLANTVPPTALADLVTYLQSLGQ